MRAETANAGWLIANLAARQHGVVSVNQLYAAGLTHAGVSRRVHAGRLHRIHRGVYAVGHPAVALEGRWMAAVLACGDRAALSHRAAAALWRLLPPPAGPIDVTVAAGRRQHRGIVCHRSQRLSLEHCTRRHGIPVTTPARTIADLRRVAPPAEIRRALRQAAVGGGHAPEVVEADHTRSELEHLFLRLVRRHRLPHPLLNARVDRYRVDFLWPDRRLIVETDGYRYHHGAVSFEEDRLRDQRLRLLGYDVVRFTYRQVADDSGAVTELLRALL